MDTFVANPLTFFSYALNTIVLLYFMCKLMSFILAVVSPPIQCWILTQIVRSVITDDEDRHARLTKLYSTFNRAYAKQYPDRRRDDGEMVLKHAFTQSMKSK